MSWFIGSAPVAFFNKLFNTLFLYQNNEVLKIIRIVITISFYIKNISIVFI